MRIAFFLLCWLPGSVFSQERNIRINVFRFEIGADSVYVDLNSQMEDLNRCTAKVLDSAGHTVMMQPFPMAIHKPGIKQWTASRLDISGLPPGIYRLLLLTGKEEFYMRKFRKVLQNVLDH